MSSEDNHPRFVLFNRFKQYLETKGIIIKSYEFQDFQMIGNSSGIYKVKYTYDQNGQLREKSVLLKIPSLGFLYDHLQSLKMYDNEMITYNVILPEMYKLWNGVKFAPESYQEPGSCDLIIEDLTSSGYRVFDKLEQLDLPHSIAVLQALAKFHGTSIKLHEMSPQIMEMLHYDFNTQPGTLMHNYVDSLFDRFIKTVEDLSFPDDVVRKLQNYKDNHLWNEVLRANSLHSGVNVLCHSDLWTSNILFKYNEQREIEDVKLIDFQAAHKACPVVDIMQFFILGVKFEVLEQNRELLLESYINTLDKTLNDLQCRTSYGKHNLIADLKTFKLLYVCGLVTNLPMILSAEGNSANNENEKILPYTSQVYRNALCKWINYLARENIL